MDSKLPCTKCGVMILPTTSKKNNGLCMPCINGIRESLESSKIYYAKERELDKTCPFRAFWSELVDKVYNSSNGFENLNIEEKQYFAVNLLDGEVYNGGFDQYFFNSSSDYFKYAELGLISLKAKETLSLLRSAKITIFGNKSVPVDTVKRRDVLLSSSVDVEKILNDLDDKYYHSAEEIGELLSNFALENKLIKQ